jgi:hypothetical protein
MTEQTTVAKELSMWFRSVFDSLNRHPGNRGRRPPRRWLAPGLVSLLSG